MRVKKYVLILFILGIMLFSMKPVTAFADSPVTSTDFYRAYMDVDMVRIAKDKGVIDEEIANYLYSSKNPIDVKAAVINALGWKFEGKSNAKDYVKLMYATDIEKLDFNLLSGDELFCIGYMMTLDDYFNVEKALVLMDKACEKNNTSFTMAMVRSVVKGQDDMLSKGTCKMVWLNTDSVLKDMTLVKDMKQEGVDIITDYMRLYKE